MKCAKCGLPLSPKRQPANCPRCGTPVKSAVRTRAAVGSAQPGFFVPSARNPSNGRGLQAPISPPLEPAQGWQSGIRDQAGPAPFWSDPSGQQPPGNNRNSRLGFTIAGLCIVAGALLLVFVYFMAIGGQGNQNGATNGTQTTSTATAPPSSSPTTLPSPTATSFPGQQYIDNARMSSSQPPPLKATSTFKTNQTIYVAFDLHPNGHSGAVCLVWYLNGQKVTSFNFKAGGNSHSSYAYAIYGGTGPGSVELYWAGDPSCKNGLLAQEVAFTVTK